MSKTNTISYNSSYNQNIMIEVAILKDQINLPDVSDELDKHGKLHTPDLVYQNMIGNFYIPILTPLVEDNKASGDMELEEDNSTSYALQFKAPSTYNILNNSMSVDTYEEANYIQLIIPKYILLNFRYFVPARTKFLIAIVGGKVTPNNINIIGLYTHDL